VAGADGHPIGFAGPVIQRLTMDHTNLTKEEGISDEKFVLFVRFVVEFRIPGPHRNPL
jgi:hypothetical protein